MLVHGRHQFIFQVFVDFRKSSGKLTGLKLDSIYLSSGFLSVGITVVTAASPGKVYEMILLSKTF